ncbi:MAG: sigma 54-interacting transcriptional regulator [Candidatus Krumholzibacteriia bacterium]
MKRPVPTDPAASEGLEAMLPRVPSRSFLSVLAVLREGILALDGDLRIVAMNRTAAEIVGRTPRDMLGVNICEFFGRASCPHDTLAEALQRGERIHDFQTTVQLGDGREGQVLLRSVPLKALDGATLGMAVILGDVTEVTELRKQISGRQSFAGLVGRDRRMQELYRLIQDVGPSDASVLVRGESGTGKELVARAIHEASTRADGPFVSVNCSALSEGLLESELFGHVRGSFTGAVADRRGRFEEASGGTLFLDEIGDVSPVVQVKLLRVLQERRVERVGDNRPVPVNVRLVSATNRDLEGLLATGRLREDFYYRIKVVSIVIPPLRDRTEDIPLLAEHFLARMARDRGVADLRLHDRALERLMRHAWPGNVRELENALEHAVVLSRGDVVAAEHLPPEVGRLEGGRPRLGGVPVHSQQERDVLAAALRRTGWNRTRAARLLGIDRTTLWRKIREYGLTPDP